MHHREIHEQMLRAGISLTTNRPEVREYGIAAIRCYEGPDYERAGADAIGSMANLLDQFGGEDINQTDADKQRSCTSRHSRSSAYRTS